MTRKIESRSTALNRFMVIPIILATILAVFTGVLVYKMTEDRVATGERIKLSLQGECLSEASSVILKRAENVGVGNPLFSEGNRSLEITLPEIENAKTHIPHLLLRQGVWEMRDGETIVLENKDIKSVELSLDESGMPEALLTFDPASKDAAQKYLKEHIDDSTVIWIDDQMVISRPNRIDISDDFRLVSEQTDPRVRMQESADFVILLSNPPLDCVIDWTVL